jgi:hypothetical protein
MINVLCISINNQIVDVTPKGPVTLNPLKVTFENCWKFSFFLFRVGGKKAKKHRFLDFSEWTHSYTIKIKALLSSTE